MKFQIASDLHLEFLEARFGPQRLIEPHTEADALILAGDIASGIKAVQWFASWPVPVLYVAGNHEFYDLSWAQTRADLQSAAKGSAVTVLDNGQAVLDGVRILGSTLWTDYHLNGSKHQQASMTAADRGLMDHRIRTQEGPFRAAHALADHEQSIAWLARKLAEPFEGKTVVITHHAPHRASIHDKWKGAGTAALNPAFASDLTDQVVLADLWVHGHTHDGFDYQVGRAA